MGAATSTPAGTAPSSAPPPLTTAQAAAAATARPSGGAAAGVKVRRGGRRGEGGWAEQNASARAPAPGPRRPTRRCRQERAPFPHASSPFPFTPAQDQPAAGAKLYRFAPDRTAPAGGAWELVAADVRPSFFDAAEDERGDRDGDGPGGLDGPAKPRWCLEIGDLEAAVTDEYAADAAERRLTLALPSAADDPDAPGAGGGVWALRFPPGPAFRAFLDRYELCLYENAFGASPAARAAAAGGGGGREAARSPPPPGADEAFGPDSVLNLGPGGVSAASRAAWAAEEEEDEDMADAAPGPDTEALAADAILGLRLGAGDRSYLVRGGGRIEALANVPGGVRGAGVGFTLTPPPGASSLGGGGRGGRDTPSTLGRAGGTTVDAGSTGGTPSITPSRLLLMDRERRLAALGGGGEDAATTATPGTGRDRIFDADLETGTVVAAWALRKDGVDVAMDDLANETRAAQLDGRSTFLGLASNRLVRWDLRDARGAVAEADLGGAGSPGASSLASPAVATYAGGKDYARGARFTCMATSGDGCVAVGSADGQVRLYSERTLTRAATSIPGLGAPVTAIDVTFDGGWVLATTDKYLMLLKTSYTDAKTGSATDGFHSRMGSSAPAPRLLRLRPEDAARTGHAPLAKGKFTWVTEPGRKERWIAASCGSATLLWNFKAVRAAPGDNVGWGGLTACTQYSLIPKGESVVDSVFMADRQGGGGVDTPPPGRGGGRGGGGRPGAGGTPGRGTPGGAAMVIVTDKHVFSTARGRRGGGGGSSSDEEESE